MNVQLNHTIVWCRDQAKSTEFLTRILGLPPAKRFMHFLVIELSNEVSIDYFETTDSIALQHLAFKVSEQDFDVVLGRLREHVPQIWADPARTQPGEINHFGGGRGASFRTPTAICSRCSRARTGSPPDDAVVAAPCAARSVRRCDGQCELEVPRVVARRGMVRRGRVAGAVLSCRSWTKV